MTNKGSEMAHDRLLQTIGAALALSLVLPGCTSDLPYSTVQRGETAEFRELSLPGCPTSDCRLVVNVVNSYQETVRTLYEGPPDALVEPVEWDTRDDDGAIVPSGVYIMRAWLDGSRADSWTVLVIGEDGS
jgi:hypothetical protein